jgi:hypothetical protein
MRRIIYSTDVEAWKLVCDKPELYICPRSRVAAVEKIVNCPVIAVEDVTDTPTWLRVNSMARDGIPIVYDRVARYYKVGNEKARRLSRLAEIGTVSLVDIVPFCEHRQFLYMPVRYVNRTILGYSHFYAFSGGHMEEIDGRIVHSLDCDLLSSKLSPHVALCRPAPGPKPRVVLVEATDEERAGYAARREELFEKCKTPIPILTRLADYSHATESRREAVRQLCVPGTCVITNIGPYAAVYKSFSVDVGTYDTPPKTLAACTRLVFAEPPIAITYRRFDIEAQLSAHCEVFDIVGRLKVDLFLSGRIAYERNEISTFMGALNASL